jgi:hypothetical protein
VRSLPVSIKNCNKNVEFEGVLDFSLRLAQPSSQGRNDLTDNPEQKYLADGLTEELITDLSQIQSLRVISKSLVKHLGAK